MKNGNRLFAGLSRLLALLGVALIAGRAYGQAGGFQTSGGFTPQGIVFLVVMGIVGLLFYIYLSLTLQVIATKTSTANGWLAWIPIANIFLMLMVGKKPMWWFILLLIPLVNIVITIIVWMAIAEARGKPNWWGIVLIVPIVGLVVPGYLAWSS
jgi:ABC-type Na+ efflux pump permease subunit